jgi:hypothetical protein
MAAGERTTHCKSMTAEKKILDALKSAHLILKLFRAKLLRISKKLWKLVFFYARLIRKRKRW